jgi:CheY-like chemotaxis protein
VEEKNVIQNVVSSEESDNQINPEDSGLKILIAEDDKISEKLIEIAVIPCSKEILKVRTGVEAVETLRNQPDIDLVLMDIQLPVMDGYEATRQIRKFNKKVIIIAQTAYALAGDRLMALEAGCDDYISKPINLALLTALINKYFKK